MGNYRGGVTFFRQNNEIVSVETVAPQPIGSLNLYPNPASERLTLSYTGLQPGSGQVTIFAITGQAVITEQYVLNSQSGQLDMDLGKLLPGIYFVQLSQGNQVMTRKLVVQ